MDPQGTWAGRIVPGAALPWRAAVLMVAVALLVVPAGSVVAPVDIVPAVFVPGELDPTFDHDGIAVTSLFSQVHAADAKVDEEGGIHALLFNGPQTQVWRFLVDGDTAVLDPDFGDAGVVVLDVPPGMNLRRFALRPDGLGYVVTGFPQAPAATCGTQAAISRFDRDGAVDATFGTTDAGRVLCVDWDDIFNQYDIAVDADDQFVLLATGGSVQPFAVTRGPGDTFFFTEPDPCGTTYTLGNEGRVLVRPDGRIAFGVLAGRDCPDPDGSVFDTVVIAGHLEPGPPMTFDSSFGGGWVVEVVPRITDEIELTLTPNGGLAGATFGTAETSIHLFDWAANGTLLSRDEVAAGAQALIHLDGVATSPLGVVAAGVGDTDEPDAITGIFHDTLVLAARNRADELAGARLQSLSGADVGDQAVLRVGDDVFVVGRMNSGSRPLDIDDWAPGRQMAVSRVRATGSPPLELEVDPTFASNGYALFSGGIQDRAYAVAVQPDLRVLAAGTEDWSNGSLGFVLRHLEDGTLDPEFGPGGVCPVQRGISCVDFVVAGMALADDGTIVIVGGDQVEGMLAAVHRLLSDGQPDPTFNGGSHVLAGVDPDEFCCGLLGGFDEQFRDVAIQPDGRIVAVGDGSVFHCEASECSMQHWVIVAQFLPDGSLDPSFGDDGVSLIGPAVGGAVDRLAYGTGVALDPNGRIVVSGAILEPLPPVGTFAVPDPTASTSLLVARLEPDGSRDVTFADGLGDGFGPGVLLDPVVGTDDFGAPHSGALGNDVAVGEDGRVVVTGSVVACVGDNGCELVPRLLALQFLADGQRDATFAGDGAFVWGPDATTRSSGTGVTLDPLGNVVASGTAGEDLVVVRLLPDGTTDPLFGADGIVVTDIGGEDAGNDIALAPDAKILVAGSTADLRGERIVVARFHTDVGTLACAPPMLDHGTLLLETENARAVTCTAQDGRVGVTSVAVDPGSDHPADWTVTLDGCTGAILAPGASCDVVVSFSPGAVGARTAALDVVHVTAAGPDLVTVALAGAGEEAGVPVFTAAPNPVDFGSLLIGQISDPHVIFAANAGTAPLTIASVNLDGAHPGDFAIEATTCAGATLAPTDTCTVTVRFAPATSAVTERLALVRFADTAPGAPHVVGLRGAFVQATLDVDPGEGPIGTEVTVTGLGFEPGVDLTILVDGVVVATVPGADVTAAGFTVTIVIPPGTPGGLRTVSGCQRCDDAAAITAETPFEVTPRLFVHPAVSRAGFVVEATGDGFPPLSTVFLSWEPGIGTTRATSDAEGTIRAFVLVFHRDQRGERELVARLSPALDPVATAQVLVVHGTSQPGDFRIRR